MRRRRYRRGEVIFHQEDPGSVLHIVEEGRVRISLPSPGGEEVVVALLGPGDCFGELALIDGEPRSATALAQEPCETLTLSRADFLDFLAAHPQAALAMMVVLCWRLRQTDGLVADVAFLDGPSRLAKRLLELAARQGQPASPGVELRIRVTQRELAGMTGATRESVNRWLSLFRSQGYLRLGGGTITLVSPDELAAWLHRRTRVLL